LDPEGHPINPAGMHTPKVVKHRKNGESQLTIETATCLAGSQMQSRW